MIIPISKSILCKDLRHFRLRWRTTPTAVVVFPVVVFVVVFIVVFVVVLVVVFVRSKCELSAWH